MGALGVEQRARRAAHGGRREREGRKKDEKKKKGEKKKRREGAAARFAAAVGHARAAASGRTAMHAERGEEGDGTVIGIGVGTADCREMISGDWELGREEIFETD